ncbi:MAG: hypothetical protein KBG28_23355 [Kofleriaceae bacterium]|jgi:hypothetical protein|nr:hypothetical protein [Kofleriaceae bacterium]MBP6835829.1 hypothetical protein [Kofleriaceae bacterium]MBP9206926.1 hypothetical protein [Kofleriaceae bacterium]
MIRVVRSSSLLVLGVLLASLAAGCFDSLVGGRCGAGWAEADGVCVQVGPDGPGSGPDADPDGDAGPDAGPPADGPDAGPLADAGADADAGPVCVEPEVSCPGGCADLQVDPFNCGSCGRVCATGLCAAGVCVGEVPGHVVMIGHDYVASHAASVMVLGNAVNLGVGAPIRVGIYRGTASPAAISGGEQALARARSGSPRAWDVRQLDATLSTLATTDVVVILAQGPDAAASITRGAAWAGPLAGFMGRGGVVVAFEGAAGSSHDLLDAAGLVASTGTVTITGATVTVVGAADAVMTAVPSPYAAVSTSVGFLGVGAGVVADDGAGHPVVVHITSN